MSGVASEYCPQKLLPRHSERCRVRQHGGRSLVRDGSGGGSPLLWRRRTCTAMSSSRTCVRAPLRTAGSVDTTARPPEATSSSLRRSSSRSACGDGEGTGRSERDRSQMGAGGNLFGEVRSIGTVTRITAVARLEARQRWRAL